MAISEITVNVNCKSRSYARLVILLGHLAIRLGADIDKTTSWMVRRAFKITVT